MTAVTVRRAEAPLPCPMLYLHDAAALGQWHGAILSAACERGERALTLSCFPTLAPCDLSEGCAAIAAAVQDVLSRHSDVEQLTLLCEGDEVFAALSALFV